MYSAFCQIMVFWLICRCGNDAGSQTGMDLGTGREGGDCDAHSFVAFNVELCCKGEVGDRSGCVLLTFHMMEFCWER